MGQKYVSQSISGYNQSPPADDGSAVDSNKVTWSKHKTKLADPIKTLSEAINTALTAYVEEGPVNKNANYNTVASDHNKTIECNTNAFTVTLLSPGIAPAGYRVRIKNDTSDKMITVAQAFGIDGETSVYLYPQEHITVITDAGAGVYLTESRYVLPKRLVELAINYTVGPEDQNSVLMWQDESTSTLTMPNLGTPDVESNFVFTAMVSRPNGGSSNTVVNLTLQGTDTWWDGNSTTALTLTSDTNGVLDSITLIADTSSSPARWWPIHSSANITVP